jgi:hypothetical protein
MLCQSLPVSESRDEHASCFQNAVNLRHQRRTYRWSGHALVRVVFAARGDILPRISTLLNMIKRGEVCPYRRQLAL